MAATPSEGRQHLEYHSWIPAVVEAGMPAGVDGSIALCGPRPHCKDLSPHSGDHLVRAEPEPGWGGSCVSEWADLAEVSGNEGE